MSVAEMGKFVDHIDCSPLWISFAKWWAKLLHWRGTGLKEKLTQYLENMIQSCTAGSRIDPSKLCWKLLATNSESVSRLQKSCWAASERPHLRAKLLLFLGCSAPCFARMLPIVLRRYCLWKLHPSSSHCSCLLPCLHSVQRYLL